MNVKLTKQEKILINQLLKVSGDIRNIYKEIININRFDSKGESFIKEKCKELECFLAIEKDLYKEIKTAGQAQKLCDYFGISAFSIDGAIFDINSLITSISTETKVMFTLERMADFSNTNFKDYLKYAFGQFPKEFLNSIPKEMLKKDFADSILSSYFVEKELYEIFLSSIEDKIDSGLLTKTELIYFNRVKYNILYFIPELANKYINSGFCIPSNLYLDSKIYSDLSRVPEDIYNASKDILYKETFLSELNYILFDVSEEELTTPIAMAELGARTEFMKSLLSQIEDDNVAQEAKEMIEEIKKLEPNKTRKYNHIEKIFNNQNQGRQRHYKVSFNK